MINRRSFVTSMAAAAAGIAARGGETPRGVSWPIGCMNRAWAKWSYEEALAGIKAAGFKLTGLLMRSREEPLTAADATPEYLMKLKERMASHGLTPIMSALRSRHDLPVERSIEEVLKQVDNAALLGTRFLLTFGVDKSDEYKSFYRTMHEAAEYASKRKVHIVMKPHGGASGASGEIQRCIGEVAHPNFKIWYDAGNIIHYTGKDPVRELEPIARHVTGFCAKDCREPKGDVMIQLGAGKVDFKEVFRVLKAHDFRGPILIEGTQPGQTLAETNENAQANREFLEGVLASV